MYLQQATHHELRAVRPTDRRIIVILSAIVILIVVCMMWMVALPSLQKPLIMDEMEFPAVARAIKETGLPNYYRGETNSSNQGLWHPPLYILTLAVWQIIFGSSVLSNRAFGLFNACLSLVLVGIFIVRRWNWNGVSWRENLALLPPLLFGLGAAATAPLFIQGTILPDIDTQVLPLLITAFFLLLFQLRRSIHDRLYWIAFVLALTVQFFAKLTTPVLLIPAFMVFELVRSLSSRRLDVRIRSGSRLKPKGTLPAHAGRYRSFITFNREGIRGIAAMFFPLLAGLASLILMMAIWFVIAWVWGVNFYLPFIYMTQSANNPASLGSSTQDIITAIVVSMPGHFRYFVQWVGYPVMLLLILMIAREFLRPTNGFLYVYERAALYTFLVLLICMYIVLKPAPFEFPKYYPPLFPPLALLIADVLVALHKEKRLYLTGTILIVEIVVYIAYVANSSILRDQDFIYQIYYMWPQSQFFWDWMFSPLLISLVGNSIIWLLTRKQIGAPLLIAALAVTLGWQMTTSARQRAAPYATTYLYGERSFDKTVDYLRIHLPEDTIVIAPKDIGFSLEDHWRYIELDVDPRPYFNTPKANYLVFRSNDYYGHALQDTPDVAAAVQNQFEVVTTIDNFIVMKRTDIAQK
jgi:hypothetical protein